MGRASTLILLALVGACGDGDRVAIDAPATDALIVDADDIDYRVTGVYLDWDSTSAAPCPIVGATWTVPFDTSRVATTDAAGEFTIRLTSFYVEMDVTPPAAATTCTSAESHYELAAHAIIPPAIHYDGGHFVARSLTTARIATFYAAIGTPFDTTRAHLLVHVDGPPRTVSISSMHATAQAFDGAQWTAGAIGTDVYFPNIDLTNDTSTSISVDGGAIGTGTVALSADTLYYITVITK